MECSRFLATPTGSVNTATGSQALYSNTTPADATTPPTVFRRSIPTPPANLTPRPVRSALAQHHRRSNVANGFEALLGNTTGGGNTAIGSLAFSGNTTGNGNTALGFAAGNGVTTADNVTCIGANVARCERERHHLDC